MRGPFIVAARLAVLSLALLPAGKAVSIFSDGFESDAIRLNGSLSNWTIVRQSIDVIGLPYQLFCREGLNCVDLDGSTGRAGRIESQNFTFLSGVTYSLTFWLSENQRGFDFAGNPDVVTVSLGSLASRTIALQNSIGYVWQQYTLTLVGDGSTGAIVFDHAGGDNVGILLDAVDLDETRPLAADEVPEPATSALIGAGLVLVASWRRGRRP